MLTNYVNISDTKPIPGTQNVYQVMAEKNVRDDGEFNLHTAQLQCPCNQCIQDPSKFDFCDYKNKRRELKTVILKQGRQGNEPDKDEFGILSMKVIELKVELRERGLPFSGNKEELCNRLLTLLKEAGNDRLDQNEEYLINGNEDNHNDDNNTNE